MFLMNFVQGSNRLLLLVAAVCLAGCGTSGAARSTDGDAKSGDVIQCWFVSKCSMQAQVSPEKQSRFKVSLTRPLQVINYDPSSHQVTVRLDFELQPTSSADHTFASIFLGLISVWDGLKYPVNVKIPYGKTCKETPGCLNRSIWDRIANPILIRGGPANAGILVPFTFTYQDHVKILRVKWDFYQLEHDENCTCSIVKDKKHIGDELPWLHAVKKDGITEHVPWCYNDSESGMFLAAPKVPSVVITKH